jgi:ATP-dependent RNA helicase RhlE
LNTTFQDLGLSEAALSAVKQAGFSIPTPVQAQAIPLALAGRDIVAAAKTGTGKTAAFALPTIDRIGHSKRAGSPRALIVSPTRELAQQIDGACYALAKTSKFRVLTVVGGTPYKAQINKLKHGVDILIATPGRLFDLMERHVVKLDEVEVLVLDEADRMLDMGFWPTMKKIVAATPSTRQTLLFSATIDRKVMQNVEPILNDPAFVEIAHRGETADTVDQFIMPIAHMKKPELLNAVLRDKGSERIIVFTRTKSRSDVCTRQLQAAGFCAESIHSNKSQSQRKRALENFSKGKTHILVATDVLARGIDVSQVEHVINYDLPDCPEDYVHRIGRTGRAGEAGYAISFVSPDAKAALRDIEKLIGEEIPSLSIDSYDNSEAVAEFTRQRTSKANVRTVASFSRDARPGRNSRSGRPGSGWSGKPVSGRGDGRNAQGVKSAKSASTVSGRDGKPDGNSWSGNGGNGGGNNGGRRGGSDGPKRGRRAQMSGRPNHTFKKARVKA